MNFEHIILTTRGVEHAQDINAAFQNFYATVAAYLPEGRERSLLLTKLQEARDIAIRGMSTLHRIEE